MNTYVKYCPNVFVARCEEQYEKGDTIILETKRGKEHECIVHNLVNKNEEHFFYSITRVDGFNSQKRAENRVSQLESWAESAEKKSYDKYLAANKDMAFLSIGEPIKVGHHSEKRHRKIIADLDRNMEASVNYADKAEKHRLKTAYWERMSTKINLSMPESLEYFTHELEIAKEHHQGLKDGTIKREHSFSLTYSKKKCNDLANKVDIAKRLWA